MDILYFVLSYFRRLMLQTRMGFFFGVIIIRYISLERNSCWI